jgi:hypothetical protein
MAARRTTSSRETKVTSRKSEVTETPQAKKTGGLSMIDGFAIVTTILLIGAILLVDYHLGSAFNEGMFFKK